MKVSPEDLIYSSGFTAGPTVTTVTDVDDAALQDATAALARAELEELMRVNREMLQENISAVTLPYETFLTTLAQDAEVARRTRFMEQNPQKGWSKRRSKIMEKSFQDGEYTETDYLIAEDGKKYPYSITYRAEGKGSVGEGRVVTPISYSQVLRPGESYPDYMTDMRDPYNRDLLAIELTEGKIQDVILRLPKGVADGNGLITREGTQPVKAASDGIMFSDQAYWTSLQLAFDFNNLRQDTPKLSLQHLIANRPPGQGYYYDIKTIRFEYGFDARKNQFDGARYDKWNVRKQYSPDAYTGLLSGALRFIPTGQSIPKR